MHIPGHNPYIEEYLGTGGYNPGFSWASDPIYQYQTTGYNYSGISPEIMDALGGIFSGTMLQNFDWTNLGTGLAQEWSGEGIDVEIGDWLRLWDEGTEGFEGFGEEYTSPNIGEGTDIPMLTALDLTNVFDPESLATTLSLMAGFDELEAIRPGEVKALTPEMIEKTTSAYYEPFETAERGTLVDKLSKEMGKATTGGFAGSGGREAGLSGAERLYRGGYEDILADIMKMRGGATENVLDTIYGWQELLSQT